MTLIILGEAEQDFAKSIAYHESKEPGLGWRFRNEMAEAVKRILRNPELARLRPKGYRRVNLARFSSLHRLRHPGRHDLDRGDCARLSSPGILDSSRLKMKSSRSRGRERQVAAACAPPEQIAADPFEKLRAGSAAATIRDRARNAPVVSISSRRMDNVIYLYSRAVMKKVFVACALGFLFGCGAKNQAADDTTSTDAIRTPATVEQAARVLDL